MTDVTDRLADLGQSPILPSAPATGDGDLARGKSALRRRRRNATTATLSLAVIAAGGAVALSSSPRPGATDHGSAIPASTVPLKIVLVDYVGHEPKGFNIGAIPQGFDLQASSASEVLLAPSGDANTDPDSFVGKVAITAEAASEFDGGLAALGTQSATIGGNPGRVGDDGLATQVWWQVGSTIIDVQCWDSIGLTQDQIISFAGSVSTTPQLQLGNG
jgi:hypothetical protein